MFCVRMLSQALPFFVTVGTISGKIKQLRASGPHFTLNGGCIVLFSFCKTNMITTNIVNLAVCADERSPEDKKRVAAGWRFEHVQVALARGELYDELTTGYRILPAADGKRHLKLGCAGDAEDLIQRVPLCASGGRGSVYNLLQNMLFISSISLPIRPARRFRKYPCPK